MGVKENVVHIVKYLIFLPGVLSDMFFFSIIFLTTLVARHHNHFFPKPIFQLRLMSIR